LRSAERTEVTMNNNEAYLRLVEMGLSEDEPKVAQAGITDSGDYIRFECDGCGAELPRVTDPTCEYCGAKYAKVRRYNGPEIQSNSKLVGSMYGRQCASTSFSTPMPGYLSEMTYPNSEGCLVVQYDE